MDLLPAATAARTPEAPPSTLIFRPASYVERLKPGQIFPVSQPLEVELGSGDGSFLAAYARLHPERNFLGVERLLGRLRKLDRKGMRAGLHNLRLIRIEASYLLEYLLPRASVCVLHVYFPDPWPKRRHRKNRLVNARFTELARQTLAPHGVICLRTDDADYFAQMTTVFTENPAFQAVETPAALAEILTDFERDFRTQGIATLRAAFQRSD
ncbi:MAG: tRNA (guanosine(46)-N7)-methyltransferase TrmB [Verrucomicrobiota bacterium]|mgnify:FL=1